ERVCAVSRSVEPSLNCTEPVGVGPPPGTDTVAVNVTDVPARAGLPLEMTSVWVELAATTTAADGWAAVTSELVFTVKPEAAYEVAAGFVIPSIVNDAAVFPGKAHVP